MAEGSGVLPAAASSTARLYISAVQRLSAPTCSASACSASAMLGNRLAYWEGSARASAALGLTFRRSSRHRPTTCREHSAGQQLQQPAD